jgi:hypothetical protein
MMIPSQYVQHAACMRWLKLKIFGSQRNGTERIGAGWNGMLTDAQIGGDTDGMGCSRSTCKKKNIQNTERLNAS